MTQPGPVGSETQLADTLPGSGCTWDWACVGPLTPERRESLDQVREALGGLRALVAGGLPAADALELCRRARVTIELPGDAATQPDLRWKVPLAGGLLLAHARVPAADDPAAYSTLEDLAARVRPLCAHDALRLRLAAAARARAIAETSGPAPPWTERVVAGGIELAVRREVGGDRDVLREVIESDAYGLARLRARDVRTVIDVGAHVGAFTALAKRTWPGARVVAVEPNPRSCELLRHNVAGLPGVEVVEAAVRYDGADVLTASLASTGSGFMAHAGAVRALLPPNFRDRLWRCAVVGRVRTVTLEELAGDAPIDLLKLDCEGSEHDVLAGAADATLERCGAVVGEYHDAAGPARFEALLRRRLAGHQVQVEPGKAIGLFSCLRAAEPPALTARGG